jgi:NTE family protein
MVPDQADFGTATNNFNRSSCACPRLINEKRWARTRCGPHSHQNEKIHHGPALLCRHRSYGRKAAPRAGSAPPFECIALLLQGGGALGSYQAGVYSALAEAELQPDWVAGISIGAINGALIAGNAPERRVERLRTFWEQITVATHGLDAWLAPLSGTSDTLRGWMNQTNAALSVVGGVPGFFTPRLMAPWSVRAGGAGATNYYETAKLRSTLERLVDFDRINSGSVRFTVGAVNVRSGNLVCFDAHGRIIQRHGP